MKKLFSAFFVLLCTFQLTGLAYAYPEPENTDIIKTISARPQDKIVSTEELFITLVDISAEGESILPTYRYIEVKATSIPKDSRLYRAYQKAIYLDLIPNNGIALNLTGVASYSKLVGLIEQMYGKKVNGEVLVNGIKFDAKINKILKNKDLVTYAHGYLDAMSESTGSETKQAYTIESAPNFAIMNDVYERLLTEHADRANFDGRKLLE